MQMIEKLRYSIQDNALFIGTWLVALFTVLGINLTNTQNLSFVGVTDSKEVNLNLKHAVVVKQVYVLPGQKVEKGQLLAELERPDLDKQLNEVSHRLEELHSQLSLNETLNENLKSIKGDSKEIDNTLTIQIRSLENQIELLKKETEELRVFAQFEGHIGFVNYKAGESVSPFAPILTMHQKTPTFVRGYVHESIMEKIKIGSTIKISSINSGRVMKASVTSVGTRIIEFPERFRRSIDQKIWGREIGIALDPQNNFLLGEKVFLEMLPEETLQKKRDVANELVTIMGREELQSEKLDVPKSIRKDINIEPSGLTYVEDLDQFVLISDDTDKNHPDLFLMDRSGSISENVMKIEGLKKIKDMEAIAQDERGMFYVVSSQSQDKSGEVGKDRRRLVSFKYVGGEFVEEKKVDLLEVLNNSAILYPSQSWVKTLRKENLIQSEWKISLDVEGLVVKEDIAYLGLRRTFSEKGELIVLEIKDLTKLLNEDVLERDQVRISHKITIPSDIEGQGISDLMVLDDSLYVLTADNHGVEQGSLLKVNMNLSQSQAELLAKFSSHRPEGISLNPKTREAIIVFDNNESKKAYFTRLAL